jgi:predicted house-cleaning noncanonical NTP pyrophosphatase (MazG superfamily)
MIKYNKLIRDRIPEIIEASGKQCNLKVLNDSDYIDSLNNKLQEELNEYLESNSIEELADLVEVVYAIASHKDSSIEELEKIRLDKREKRGGFEKKLFLIDAEE